MLLCVGAACSLQNPLCYTSELVDLSEIDCEKVEEDIDYMISIHEASN